MGVEAVTGNTSLRDKMPRPSQTKARTGHPSNSRFVELALDELYLARLQHGAIDPQRELECAGHADVPVFRSEVVLNEPVQRKLRDLNAVHLDRLNANGAHAVAAAGL